VAEARSRVASTAPCRHRPAVREQASAVGREDALGYAGQADAPHATQQGLFPDRVAYYIAAQRDGGFGPSLGGPADQTMLKVAAAIVPFWHASLMRRNVPLSGLHRV